MHANKSIISLKINPRLGLRPEVLQLPLKKLRKTKSLLNLLYFRTKGSQVPLLYFVGYQCKKGLQCKTTPSYTVRDI